MSRRRRRMEEDKNEEKNGEGAGEARIQWLYRLHYTGP
jgi:hypothetical protein